LPDEYERVMTGIFPDLEEEHIMLKVKEFSWQKMILVKLQLGLDKD
jgi:hypothetical protein